MIIIIIIIIIIMLMIIMIIIMLMIIIMIIHLFAGAFQDTQGRLAKQSGKGTLSMSMGIIDLEGLE